MDNKEYAQILNEIATLQRVVGDGFFKVRAFSRAARLIEDLGEPVEQLIDRRRLDEIPGIGESIEEELEALRLLGYSPRHKELLDRVGHDVTQLWEIPGLGIKRIQILYQDLGIASVAMLKAAALEGKLAKAPQFGAAIQTKLLAEIEGWERGRGRRYPLPEAKALADSLRSQILELSMVDRAEVGGSIRRGKETIGDIDLLVTTDDPRAVASYFKNLPEVVEVIFDGESRASVRITNEIQADLRIVERHLFGAGLHYFTGDKDHHIQMRLRSKRMGLKISEKGVMLYDDPTETPVGPMNTEEEVFAAVGLPYIHPEIRNGKNEIKMGEAGTLPTLVEAHHIRGEVHICSALSGGVDRLEDMLVGCAARGYEWVVVTERAGRTRGIKPGDFADYKHKLEALNAKLGLRVTVGLEVEIMPDGMLDFDHRLLAQVPWVVGVYRGMPDEPDEATDAIMWAMETGLVSCLAAPTGRHLGVHEGHGARFDDVVACSVDFGVALELSGDPQRLDLNGQFSRRARDGGAHLVVSSSAASVDGLSNIDYALQQARRGWLTPADILNTLAAEDAIQRTRVLING